MTIRTLLTLFAGAVIGYAGEVAPVATAIPGQACVNCAVPAATSVVTQQQYQIPVTATTTSTTQWDQQPMQAVGQVQTQCTSPTCATAAPVTARAGCGLRGKLRGKFQGLKSRRASRRALRAGC